MQGSLAAGGLDGVGAFRAVASHCAALLARARKGWALGGWITADGRRARNGCGACPDGALKRGSRAQRAGLKGRPRHRGKPRRREHARTADGRQTPRDQTDARAMPAAVHSGGGHRPGTHTIKTA